MRLDCESSLNLSPISPCFFRTWRKWWTFHQRFPLIRANNTEKIVNWHIYRCKILANMQIFHYPICEQNCWRKLYRLLGPGRHHFKRGACPDTWIFLGVLLQWDGHCPRTVLWVRQPQYEQWEFLVSKQRGAVSGRRKCCFCRQPNRPSAKDVTIYKNGFRIR